MIIGEAVAGLSSELRHRYPDIPWTDIKAFRNIVVHVYFATDEALVWTAATRDAPYLRDQVAAILAEEYPRTSS